MRKSRRRKFVANQFAAQVLERSANGYAAAACDRLLEQRPQVSEHFAPNSAEAWRKHYVQRVQELAAAVGTGEPAIFAARVAWSRQAFEARGLNTEDLAASIDSLRDVLAEQLPDTATQEVMECIKAAQQGLDDILPEEASDLDATTTSGRTALLYLQAVLEGNVRPAIEIMLDAVDGGISVQSAFVDILLPAQREVGRLWHLDQVSVAEEHLVSTTTQRVMAILVQRAEHNPDNGKTAVAAAVAGNIHDLGIRAIAYLLELEGWRTLYLGADVPREDLPAAAQFFGADVLLLSCALSVQLKNVTTSIAHIKEICDPPPKIMVGGLAFRDAPDAWKAVGADGYAVNIPDTLALAETLIAK